MKGQVGSKKGSPLCICPIYECPVNNGNKWTAVAIFIKTIATETSNVLKTKGVQWRKS